MPLANARRYAPGYDAPLAAYLAQLDAHGVSHGVLIQPSFLGFDNSQMLAAIAAQPQRLKGIAVVPPDMAAADLQALDRQGIVGIRLNLFGRDTPDLSGPEWRGLLSRIETLGWRWAYLGLGGFVLACQLVALILIPRQEERVEARTAEAVPRPAREEFGMIFRSRIFWLILIGFFLCLLVSPLHSSQMNVMLGENGLTPQTASYVVSIYALATILGRVACGLALDRFPTPYVTTASMILRFAWWATMTSRSSDLRPLASSAACIASTSARTANL